MTHTSFTLNGTWEMSYIEEKYLSSNLPLEYIYCKMENFAGTEPDDISSTLIEDADRKSVV